jgi:hypothetical protein
MRGMLKVMLLGLAVLLAPVAQAAPQVTSTVDLLELPPETTLVARKRASKARRSTSRPRARAEPQPELNGVLAGLATSCTLGVCTGGAGVLGAVLGTLPCLCIGVSGCTSVTAMGSCACGLLVGYGLVPPAVMALASIPGSALSGVVAWMSTRGLSPPLWALMLGGMGGGLATFLTAAVVGGPLLGASTYFAYNAWRAQTLSPFALRNDAVVNQLAYTSMGFLASGLAVVAVVLVAGFTATGILNGGLAWWLTPRAEESMVGAADEDEEDADDEDMDEEEEDEEPQPRRKSKKPRKKLTDDDARPAAPPARKAPPPEDVVPAQPTPKDEELVPRVPTPVLPEDVPPPSSSSGPTPPPAEPTPVY